MRIFIWRDRTRTICIVFASFLDVANQYWKILPASGCFVALVSSLLLRWSLQHPELPCQSQRESRQCYKDKKGLPLSGELNITDIRLKSMKQRNPGQGQFDALEALSLKMVLRVSCPSSPLKTNSADGFLGMVFQMACHYALILLQQHIWVWDNYVLLNSFTCR